MQWEFIETPQIYWSVFRCTLGKISPQGISASRRQGWGYGLCCAVALWCRTSLNQGYSMWQLLRNYLEKSNCCIVQCNTDHLLAFSFPTPNNMIWLCGCELKFHGRNIQSWTQEAHRLVESTTTHVSEKSSWRREKRALIVALARAGRFLHWSPPPGFERIEVREIETC
jgi:hypothetical protein